MTLVDDTLQEARETTPTHAQRALLARSVLRRAELSARRSPAGPAGATGEERLLPVPDELADLLPFGGLQRGTAVVVDGSTSLLLALLSEASRTGAWIAMVGFPRVGVLAAAEAGIDLARVALVPSPGPDTAAAVAALLDGIDVVVLGPDAALSDADRRRLASRARERGSLLIATQPWDGAHVVLTVREGTWTGADHGAGRLRRRRLTVLRTGRAGAARGIERQVELPLRGSAVKNPRQVAKTPPDLRLVG
ncbi:hypothetical protein [Oerskovia turbata]